MSAKHTPGPWALTGWTAGDDFGWSIRIADAPYRLEVSAWCAESEADARLIAAAPDLLEALEAVLAVPEARKALVNWGTDELLAARAAVAKARGGE